MIQTIELKKIKADLESTLSRINTEINSETMYSQMEENRLYNVLSRHTELPRSEIVEIIKAEMELR